MAPLIEFMGMIKSKEVRETVAYSLILQWEVTIAGKDYAFGKVLPRKRLVQINAALCVLERFLPSNETTLAKIQRLRHIRKLQVRG